MLDNGEGTRVEQVREEREEAGSIDADADADDRLPETKGATRMTRH
jgi:hypothetical protein